MGLDYIQDREDSLKARIEEIRKKVEKSYPSKNGLKIPEIVMLYYARTYKTEHNNFQQFWYYDYAVDNPQAMLKSLEQRGFIYPATAKESLSNLKIPELKELLKELDLKVSGKKEELITKIIENAQEDWLKEKIKNRAYNLTDLALQELEENKYVSYFHKVKIKYGLDVWWVNQQLYIRNYPKSLYRDLIYGELNRRLNEIREEMQSGDGIALINYGHCKYEISEFFIEKNRFNQALDSMAEYAYCIINENLLPYIDHGVQYVSERVIPVKIFKKLRQELELSDDEMFQRLVNVYNMINFPASFALLSNQDTAGLIVSLMNGENEIVEEIFHKLENNSNDKIRARFDNSVNNQHSSISTNNNISIDLGSIISGNASNNISIPMDNQIVNHHETPPKNSLIVDNIKLTLDKRINKKLLLTAIVIFMSAFIFFTYLIVRIVGQ